MKNDLALNSTTISLFCGPMSTKKVTKTEKQLDILKNLDYPQGAPEILCIFFVGSPKKVHFLRCNVQSKKKF